MRRLAALALLVAPGALAALGFEVQVDARPRNAGEGKPFAALEKVRIGERHLVVESGARRAIIDFAARKKYAIDLAARTYSEGSLYVDAGFRAYEIQNREFLARVLDSTQAEKAKQMLPLAEHELSVLHPQPSGGVRRDGTSFRVGELVVFGFTPGGEKLSDADAAGFARYLRYFKGGHPAALRALEEQRIAPAEIGMVTGSFQGMQTTLRVRAVPLEQAPGRSLEGLKKVAQPASRTLSQDLADAAFRIGEAPPAEIGRAVEAAGHRAESLVVQGRPVPGFLAAMEYLLAGGPASELLRKHRGPFTSSAELKEIMPALNNAPDKAGAERAIATLSAARQRLGGEAYILGVFEANHHVALGQTQQAAELFSTVLRRNPYLAGAWKDLGDLLFRQWEPTTAWLCWDTGRRIAPRFGTFAAINQLEERLLREQPDYF